MTVAAGHMEGSVHVLPLRVYYEDTDASGNVYYANYLRFIERARSDMLRLAGVDHGELLAREGVHLAVRRCEMDYLAPARLDDALEVRTRLLRVAGAALNAEQIVRRDDGTELMRSKVRIACLSREGRPRRLPHRVRTALATHCRIEA